MEFLVDRAELRLIFYVSNSQTYVLHQDGKLTYPDNWCGSGKRFCLRTASNEFAKLNCLEMPSDETIVHFWNSIVLKRHQEQVLELANKKAKKANKTKTSS